MERILYGKLFGKKLVSLILVGAMLLGLTACGQGAVNQGQGSSETASETAFETASEATTEAGKSTFIAQAVDLMEGITAQDVTEKALDETFATAMTDFASGKYVIGDIRVGDFRKRSILPMAIQSIPSSAALSLII